MQLVLSDNFNPRKWQIFKNLGSHICLPASQWIFDVDHRYISILHVLRSVLYFLQVTRSRRLRARIDRFFATRDQRRGKAAVEAFFLRTRMRVESNDFVSFATLDPQSLPKPCAEPSTSSSISSWVLTRVNQLLRAVNPFSSTNDFFFLNDNNYHQSLQLWTSWKIWTLLFFF